VAVLAGGVGSRFWPVSTPARPKQLLPLASPRPLIRDTLERTAAVVPRERVRVLTGEHLAGPILAALPGYGTDVLMIEPRARGTAPVLAWAAHTILRADPNAVMASLHADHVIEPAGAFHGLLRDMAATSVALGRLLTIGAPPTRPETGYGYIRPGARLLDSPLTFGVDRFVEKPLAATAAEYVAQGYLWNTGIFVWPAALFLDELRRHTPELSTLLTRLDAGDVDGFFARAPNLSIDEGLLERSDRVAVVRATFSWDDVGAWDALLRTREPDAAGNVAAAGRVHAVDATGCIAWADEGDVVLYGTRDLVVVRTRGITFVAPRERVPHLKELLDRLPPALRDPEA
jgi:mannose-1-phosphate guanylyltransferase